MIRCRDCEFCVVDDKGRMQFRCNPFDNVVEPECLHKWMLLKLDMLLRAQQSTLGFYNKFAPFQEKMLKYLEREINELDETERWKYCDDEEDPPPDDRLTDYDDPKG